MNEQDEVKRIKSAYRKRDLENKATLYSWFSPATLFVVYEREKMLLKLLKKHGFSDLTDAKILDLGCGEGGFLRRMVDFGAKPENLYGIDLLPDRIEKAKTLSPNMDFRYGNAEKLPYQDEFFDIVSQFTVFTSILDEKMKKNIAKEMLRVLKPGGITLWYDYFISKPTNPDVKGVGKKEIRNLFPGCEFDFKKVTLAPPIARKLAPISWLACYLLEKIPFLRTHYLAVIKKVE